MKKPTSNDVARLAEVSQSTVSFVLNKRPDVTISQKTIEKVEAAARALNYIPNHFAKCLKTNNSRLIGLMVPTLTNPYYPSLTQHIEEYAASKGYSILLCNTYRNAEKEDFYLTLLEEKSVDCIIYEFTPQITEKTLKVSQNIPIIIVGEKDEGLNIDTIGLNSFKAGELLAQHLVDLNHKNIAFITSPVTFVSLSRQKRLNGIMSVMEKYNISKNLIIKSDSFEQERSDSTYEIEIGYNLTLDLLKTQKVTAIIGVNDMVAFGALTAISHLGLKIPDDISVCGFDNIYLSKLMRPKMTTVDHFILHRSKLAVDIVINKALGKENEVFKVEYDPKLIIRESTGFAANRLNK